jgi:23S rRNA (cytidine1920-2'-O)/16S rRNA (cytidine1409-2'-O)-methyltransferase
MASAPRGFAKSVNFLSRGVRDRRISTLHKSKMSRRPSNSESAVKKPKPGKARLDILLVERDLAPSRRRAQALLLAGQVRVDGSKVDKAGAQVPSDARIEIVGETSRYASRAGQKLEGALGDFALSPRDRVCIDVGSSTGGFTDCLLQNGARKVFAIDVTINQLDWKLRNDPRVVTIERNARYLTPQDIAEPADFITVDVSFISVTKILAAIVPLASPGANFVILIKPQFELERRDVGKGGIVRDSALHQKAIGGVTDAAATAGLEIISVHPSRLTGAEGNQEFFLHARRHE